MTLYIEDLIIAFSGIKSNQFDSSFMNNMAGQIGQGNSLTEKQATASLKILKKYQKSLSACIIGNIADALANPKFKFPFRVINKKNLISIVPYPAFNKAIKVEFPYNQELIDNIKKSKSPNISSQWNAEQKAWIFNLHETSIKLVKDIFQKFETDEEFKKYSQQIDEITDRMESYIPLLSVEDGKPIYKNVPSQVPRLSSTDILPAIFEARKAGITTYDETIETFLENKLNDPVTSQFLKSDAIDRVIINRQQYRFSNFKTIIKNLGPCLFVISPGKELESVSMIYEFLKSEGYDSSLISVMFRLPNHDNKFNEFVKSNRLNNAISEATRFVFVCTKIPKPVFKSTIDFQLVINLGHVNAHYTVREFLKNSSNVIYYLEEKSINKRLDHAYL
jgi:hypothetical protein